MGTEDRSLEYVNAFRRGAQNASQSVHLTICGLIPTVTVTSDLLNTKSNLI